MSAFLQRALIVGAAITLVSPTQLSENSDNEHNFNESCGKHLENKTKCGFRHDDHQVQSEIKETKLGVCFDKSFQNTFFPSILTPLMTAAFTLLMSVEMPSPEGSLMPVL